MAMTNVTPVVERLLCLLILYCLRYVFLIDRQKPIQYVFVFKLRHWKEYRVGWQSTAPTTQNMFVFSIAVARMWERKGGCICTYTVCVRMRCCELCFDQTVSLFHVFYFILFACWFVHLWNIQLLTNYLLHNAVYIQHFVAWWNT